MSIPEKYPVFRDPEHYMQMRVKPTLTGRLKVRFERQALDRCLEGLAGIASVCDAPSGPGRLFDYWAARGYAVHGVDFSEQMAEASREEHARLGLDGTTQQGDAFALGSTLAEPVDLVASVRFAYYFDSARRVELLKSLAMASRRYVLVQYKTTETLKGYINASRQSESRRGLREGHMGKTGCSNHEIVQELVQAGLVPLRIEPIGEFSDRVFVVAEKAGAHATNRVEVRIRPPRQMRVAVLLAILLALLYLINIGDVSFWDKEEAVYSLAARSVMQGQVLLPLVHVDAPLRDAPLPAWWIAAVSALFGHVSEWTARLANIVAAMSALGALYFFARRHINPWVALMSVAILGTSYEFWEHARSVGQPMLVTALLTFSWAGFYVLIEKGFAWPRWAQAWGLLGVAMLAGGLPVLPLTLFVLVGYLTWQHGVKALPRQLGAIRVMSGLAFALAPVVLWVAAVAARAGTEPLARLLANDPLVEAIGQIGAARFTLESLEDLPVNLLPWTLLIPLVLWELLRYRPEERIPWSREERFALSAFCFGLLFFVLMMNSADWRLVPLMPWGAIILAGAVWRQLYRSAAVELETPDETPAPKGRDFGGRLLGRRFGRTVLGVFIVLVLVMVLYGAVAAPLLDERRSIRPLAAAIDEAVGNGERLVLFDVHDERLLYYLGENYEILDDSPADIARLDELLRSHPKVAIVLRASAAPHLTRLQDTPLYLEASVVYRRTRFYLLTNEARAGLPPFQPRVAAAVGR